MVPAGAQHDIIGSRALSDLEQALLEYGLKPKEVPSTLDGASGIGGGTPFIKTVQVPIGLAGISSIVTLNVIEQDAPPLLPQYMNKKLGMVLDLLAEPGNHVDFLERAQK